MDKLNDELSMQIESTKGNLSPIMMKVFGYGDELKRRMDPEITTIKSNMLPVYETSTTHPQRLSVCLDTIGKIVGNQSEIFEEDKVTGDEIHKLMQLDVLVKCGIPLIKKASDEDFKIIIDGFVNDSLPRSLTSEAEVVRLTDQMSGDLNLAIALKDTKVNEMGTTGIDFKSSVPAVEQLKDALITGSSVQDVLSKLSELD